MNARNATMILYAADMVSKRPVLNVGTTERGLPFSKVVMEHMRWLRAAHLKSSEEPHRIVIVIPSRANTG